MKASEKWLLLLVLGVVWGILTYWVVFPGDNLYRWGTYAPMISFVVFWPNLWLLGGIHHFFPEWHVYSGISITEPSWRIFPLNLGPVLTVIIAAFINIIVIYLLAVALRRWFKRADKASG